jgi:putative ABC transport system permease protein
VLLLFRPGIIRRYKPTTITSYAMFQNYFKIGWRNLLHNKGYSIINIGGLAIGMMVAILIGLWVHDELSYNRYHKNYDRIVQFMKSGLHDGTPYSGGFTVQYPLIDELRTKHGANFKYIVEASFLQDCILSSGERKVSRKGRFMGSRVAEMLSLEMIAGNYDCLEDPRSILLSVSSAKAMFGDKEAMGQHVMINNQMEARVTGVYADLPRNSEFSDVSFFAPWELNLIHRPKLKEQSWDNHFLQLYAELSEKTTVEQANENIKNVERNAIAGIESLKEQFDQKPMWSANPMKDWHLYSTYDWNDGGKLSDKPLNFVLVVATIGAFVLMLACINFMNLSTARSEKRAREVGVRKSMGSARSQLISQFFSESYLVVLLAFVLAIAFASVALPYFNDLAGKQMRMPWGGQWFWIGALIFILITGLLAGSYPALYWSSFSPVRGLKGNVHTGRHSSVPRKILVVMQFTVSVTLIISTIIVYNQVTFAKDRPVGYTREGLIMVRKKSKDFNGKAAVLREELKKTGVVQELAESGGEVTNLWSGNKGFSWKQKSEGFDPQFGTLGISPEYGRTVGWQFITGRDFSEELPSDSAAIVMNESAAKVIGFDHVVGEIIHWKNKNWEMDRDFTVVGVIKDMVMESPYEPTEPTIFLLNGRTGYFNIRITPGSSTSDALLKIEDVFRKIIPSAPFEYTFVDDEYNRKFEAEERIGKLASVFSVLAILISCLGLFGLASFVAEQRTKELGIRKVLGASVLQLWKLLSVDFLILVVIACGVAIPLSLYFMTDWLNQFEYRSMISWATLGLVALVALSITLLTVSYQALRAAFSNPVDSLRTE